MDKALERKSLSKDLIKSKKRVADHGEVFTPEWLVEAMLDLTGESDRIEARFLEPACGNGNFLTRILQRKLAIVEIKSRRSSIDRSRLALIALMSIYGIELLEDNITECRKRLLDTFAEFLNLKKSDDIYQAALNILRRNIVHGDALKMLTVDNDPIIFSEWQFLGKGRFRRLDFRFDALARKSSSTNLVEINSKRIEQEPVAPAEVLSSVTVSDIAFGGKASSSRKTL